MTTDERFMHRCLQLARNGMQNAKPNPMVGAVIVAADSRIIGEGYHVRCGEGHAEVNAFASVKPEDEQLLHEATIYVSLEPCSHYGKTPPCADLIIKKGVRRCVVGCVDPFAKVKGRGIKKIQDAGIEVTVGVLEAECRKLNKRFMTYNEHHRPYILLKWAETANHFIDDHGKALAISTAYTRMLSHKLRAENDAILVGRVTDERENPQLNTRDWAGKSPRRIVIGSKIKLFEGMDMQQPVLPQLMQWLYDEKCQSLIVEGGRTTLQSFIDAGLWDEIRIETAPITVDDGTKAPEMPKEARLVSRKECDGNIISVWENLNFMI